MVDVIAPECLFPAGRAWKGALVNRGTPGDETAWETAGVLLEEIEI